MNSYTLTCPYCLVFRHVDTILNYFDYLCGCGALIYSDYGNIEFADFFIYLNNSYYRMSLDSNGLQELLINNESFNLRGYADFIDKNNVRKSLIEFIEKLNKLLAFK